MGQLLQDDDPKAEVEEDEMAHLVANRMGEVLGPHAILKEDHFPGISHSLRDSSSPIGFPIGSLLPALYYLHAFPPV